MIDSTSNMSKNDDYNAFIKQIKSRIQSSQIKAAISVNQEMLKLYWFIGSEIVKKQETANWGDGLLKQISDDLQKEFPEMKGFSVTNIKYMKNWFLFWRMCPQVVDDLNNANRQQLVAQLENCIISAIFQIPWGHNREIITKIKNSTEALFYVNKTNWRQ